MLDEQLLAENYFDTLHTAHRSLRSAFELREASGLTQEELANKLGVDKGLISRRLSGKENYTLKTLSHMASGLDCYIVVSFVPDEEMRSGNQYSLSWKSEDIFRTFSSEKLLIESTSENEIFETAESLSAFDPEKTNQALKMTMSQSRHKV